MWVEIPHTAQNSGMTSNLAVTEINWNSRSNAVFLATYLQTVHKRLLFYRGEPFLFVYLE